MCTDAYRAALIQALSATLSPVPDGAGAVAGASAAARSGPAAPPAPPAPATSAGAAPSADRTAA